MPYLCQNHIYKLVNKNKQPQAIKVAGTATHLLGARAACLNNSERVAGTYILFTNTSADRRQIMGM